MRLFTSICVGYVFMSSMAYAASPRISSSDSVEQPDGSVTFIEPRFEVNNHKYRLGISADSIFLNEREMEPLNEIATGICKLFGYSSLVRFERDTVNASTCKTLVEVDANGVYLGVDEVNDIFCHIVKEITCI